MGAEEARTYGLIDEIINQRQDDGIGKDFG